MKKVLFLQALIICSLYANAQKKILDHDSYDIWMSIENEQVSNDGKWICYELNSNGEANPVLKVADSMGKEILSYERGTEPVISWDSKYVFFIIKPDLEEITELKRKKTKKDDLPLDSLGIFNLASKTLMKQPHLKSLKVPEKWSGMVAYTIDDSKIAEETKDEVDEGAEGVSKEEGKEETKEKNGNKKNGKENGYTLVLHDLEDDRKEEISYVTDYVLAEEAASITYVNSGKDSLVSAGVYHFDPKSFTIQPIHTGKGKYQQLAVSRMARGIAFIADHDTTKVQIRPNELYLWSNNADAAQKVLDNKSSFLENDWVVSSDHELMFSENESRLFAWTSPPPIVEDTTLLEEEIVNVEVWSYTDGKLHTQQKVDAEDDRKKGYQLVFHINTNQLVQLGDQNVPEIEVGDEGNAKYSLGEDNQPYLQARSWEGGPDYRDLFLVDNESGNKKKITEKVRGSASLSPKAKFAFWYDRVDSAWFAYSVAQDRVVQITNNLNNPFYNELNDSPDYPSPYGVLSWTENDEKVLIYDRYDIWEIDPNGALAPVNLTKTGRSNKMTFRYVKLDKEERYISKNQRMILTGFNEVDKSEAIYEFTYGKGNMKELTSGPYDYGNFQKANDSDAILYTFQSFEIFPDLQLTDQKFARSTRISNANPQQSEYNWGNAELYTWYSLDGKELQGMLIKPEDFDPTKKYPMIVNFYEKSSNGLHRHRAPSPGRSTINYSFYASRGYVIFNPDVYYRIGYPGESAYNCVIPGVTSLIEKGFIDKDRIGVQGHSWGGYQIAYLVTQTDIFRAAEAGAPVPNMISAYGGIRWWTGLSRMFQYEHTQSRIGGTLWEYPLRFIENSPIFFVDKINTPLLIMHNDADGHVPWYQGIEFFVSLRRLGKPSWMLNYQEEPHWPLKLQHRRDFNIRLQQFFDHYLKDYPIPVWMKDGRPATQIGIEQGYELVTDEY